MVIVLIALHAVLAVPAVPDPFAFFGPSILLSADDRHHLDEGQPVALVLPGRDEDVTVFAAVPVNAGGERLMAWVRTIADLKKSPFVLAIGRFSDRPRLDDLDALALDDADLEAIRRCRPGDCGLKLAGSEIERLQRAIAGARSDWKPVLQDTFRRVVLDRVETYLKSGHGAIPAYDDRDRSASPGATFSSIVQQSPFLTRRLPLFAEYLDRYPRAPMPDVESFVYWSKERFGGKPVVSATHVSMLRGAGDVLPAALVAGRQLFATHYMNGSLALTAIMRGRPGSPNYLVYLNHSKVDVLGGFFGGLVRLLVERRLKREASDVLQGLRRRLESGEPPVAPVPIRQGRIEPRRSP